MVRIDAPGIYDIPAAVYYADPCPAPSLSSSIARELLSASPHHAWYAHPRLNTDSEFERAESDKFDLGTAAHAYLLEGETGFVIVDAPDWRTKSAQVKRAEARLAGKVPLLAERWADVQAMALAARRQAARHEDPPLPLTNGRPEPSLVWREGDVWCRARLDWLHADQRTIDDYKTSAALANPLSWTRTLFNMGYDVQAAFYLRGLRVLTGIDATFRFVVQENYPPFALAVIALGPEAQALAERKVERAIGLWRECRATGTWPGYPTRTCWADLPPWEATRWLEREAAEVPRGPAVLDDGRPLDEQLFG